MSTTSFFKTSGTSATTESTSRHRSTQPRPPPLTQPHLLKLLPQHHSCRSRFGCIGGTEVTNKFNAITTTTATGNLGTNASVVTTRPTTASTSPFRVEMSTTGATATGTAATIAVGTVTTGSRFICHCHQQRHEQCSNLRLRRPTRRCRRDRSNRRNWSDHSYRSSPTGSPGSSTGHK